jgi:DSF synthase
MDNLARLENFQGPNLGNVSRYQTQENKHQYSQLKTYYDEKYKIGWFMMDSSPRPCFTPELLFNINDYHQQVKSEMEASQQSKYDYLVLASNIDNIFNLGGDLNLFHQLIKQADREKLLTYAIECIKPIHQFLNHLDCELTTVSLVQGDALGGGFESALSANLLIAERGNKMGLPEVLFNLFPGMGAYSLLSRKIGAVMAEKIILSGKMYSTEELYEMGVVDILAEKGDGELALYKYIKKANRISNSYQAIRKVKDLCNPITYKELVDITKVWVDAALNLTEKDLRMMERLVSRQSGKFTS